MSMAKDEVREQVKKLFGIKRIEDEEFGEIYRAKLTFQCLITPELMESDPLTLATFILMQVEDEVAEQLAEAKRKVGELQGKVAEAG